VIVLSAMGKTTNNLLLVHTTNSTSVAILGFR
jgi:hypothetical protein